MKKFIVAGLLAVGLAGCGQVVDNPEPSEKKMYTCIDFRDNHVLEFKNTEVIQYGLNGSFEEYIKVRLTDGRVMTLTYENMTKDMRCTSQPLYI